MVELHFQGRAIPIGRDKLSAPLLTEKLFDNGVLKVPGSGWSVLQDLLSFLQNGRYGPNLDQRRSYAPSMDWQIAETSKFAVEGPPRILEYRESTAQPLLSDVKAYRLAAEIDFPELRLYALARMYAWHESHEDPFGILEWVYLDDPSQSSRKDQHKQEDKSQSKDSKKSPFRADSNLRKWVRDWLKAPSGDVSYPYNLQILQRRPAWKDNYIRYRKRTSEFITDVEAVQAHLQERLASVYARMPAQPYVQPPGYFGPGPHGPTPYQASHYAPPSFPHHGYISPMPMQSIPSHSNTHPLFEPQQPYVWNHRPLPTAEWMDIRLPEILMDGISPMWPGGRRHNHDRIL